MKFRVRTNDIKGQAQKAKLERRRRIDKAARIATDRASRNAQSGIRQQMRAGGLKKLGNAVGQTSALKKRQRDGDPYGVIYARGGDRSRAGQALSIYNSGGGISPVKGNWLWYPTAAAAKRYNGFKATPGGYRAAGSPLGPLKFVVLSPRKAQAYVEKAGVSVKTGRARLLGKRRSRATIAMKRVVLFEGIRNTRRTQRFDKDLHAGRESRRVPLYMSEALADMER